MSVALNRDAAVKAFEHFARSVEGVASNANSPTLDIEASSDATKDITLTIDQLEKRVREKPGEAARIIDQFVNGDISSKGADPDAEMAGKAALTDALKAAFAVK